MNGYMGVILRVDLHTRKIVKEPLKAEIARKFVGGRGLNSKVLYDELKPGIDPLGPENMIIIGGGPCNGTIIPGSQRFTITSKSPLTGFLGDSNSGAPFGAELKYAGYDMIIVEGKSEEPVCLWIEDDKVELRPAGDLWGKTTKETDRMLTRKFGDPNACVISIGPAGENLVKFANLVNDFGRGQGRTGLGAVFGSKRLKAIVARGSRGVKVAHVQELQEAVRYHHESWKKNPTLREKRAQYGPSAGWVRYETFGMLPTRNYQSGIFHKSLFQDLDGFFVKPRACFSCPAGCDHMFVINEGPFAGTHGCGVELSNLGDFGSKLGCDDMALILKATELCDDYGLDYFDMTSLMSFGMECYQRGILTQKDTDGLKLEWGNRNAILNLIEWTAYRKGIGALFAEGLREASRVIGRDSGQYAIHAKGQSLVMRDPRASKGWGLSYAVSTRGPCHIRSHLPEAYSADDWDTAVQSIFKKYKDPTNPLSEEGKGELVVWYENLQAFKNSMEICLFSTHPWMFPVPPMLARYYNAVTGSNMDENELMGIGERIINVERAFNVREGLTRKDDTLPDRMLKEPMPDGPAKGQVVNLDVMLDEYYQFRGWDMRSGLFKKEKLLQLDLHDVADELERMGKLIVEKNEAKR